MNQIHAHKVGLTLGGVFMVMHAMWALMVLMGLAKPFLDFIFNLHFLNFQYSIAPFSFFTAILLVATTGIIGYIMGYIFGWIWNLAHRASHAV